MSTTEGVRSRQSSRSRRWLAALTALALLAGLIPGSTVLAVDPEPTDMVLVWNANAVSVLGAGTTATPPGLGQGPPVSPLHLAFVHGAIYDAVNAIDGGHEPYLTGLPSAPSTASKAAAVAQAAHDVLVGLTPASLPDVKTRVDNMLAASLAAIPSNGTAENDGIAIGAAAAARMLLARTGDGRFGTRTFDATGTNPGEWRVVPPSSNNVFGWFADVTPLTMKDQDQFRTEGPLDITTPEYAADYNEVKALGAHTGSSRTAAQTMLAGFVTANPLPFMNAGLRAIATAEGLSTVDQALLLVKTSMASADALIGCWDDKHAWGFWRPQTAINDPMDDGNPLTSPQPGWKSLFPTPGYPEHPSGYNCYTAGVWYSAMLFFGTDKMAFSLMSPGVPDAPGYPGIPGSTRNYSRFTDVIRDTIDGRIFNGYHFRTGDVQGAWIGKKVAQQIHKRFFEPID